MDTSAEYIKMCEGALEVQNLMPLLPRGARPYCVATNGDLVQVLIAGEQYVAATLNGSVWLPRQDQLQEMLCEPVQALMRFSVWINKDQRTDSGKDAGDPTWYEEYKAQMKTPEQLWLAFLMSAKFDKIWKAPHWDYKFKI